MTNEPTSTRPELEHRPAVIRPVTGGETCSCGQPATGIVETEKFGGVPACQVTPNTEARPSSFGAADAEDTSIRLLDDEKGVHSVHTPGGEFEGVASADTLPATSGSGFLPGAGEKVPSTEWTEPPTSEGTHDQRTPGGGVSIADVLERLERLERSLATEVRTKRLVVAGADGKVVISTDTVDGAAVGLVHERPGREPSTVLLSANHGDDGDMPAASVLLGTGGSVRAHLDASTDGGSLGVFDHRGPRLGSTSIEPGHGDRLRAEVAKLREQVRALQAEVSTARISVATEAMEAMA